MTILPESYLQASKSQQNFRRTQLLLTWPRNDAKIVSQMQPTAHYSYIRCWLLAIAERLSNALVPGKPRELHIVKNWSLLAII